MTDSPTPVALEIFLKACKTLELGEPGQTRDRRWEGIVAAVEKEDFEQEQCWLRLAFSSKLAPGSAALSAFRRHFSDADENFAGNDREMRVLAAICLAAVVEGNDTRAASAALAVTTTSLGGTRPLLVPIDLIGLSEAAIQRVANLSRKRPDLRSFLVGETSKIDVARAIDPLRSQFDGPTAIKALSDLGDSLRAAIHATNRKQVNALRAVDSFLSIQDEELQMLWWLIDGRSWIRGGQEFLSVPQLDRPFVFSVELAGFTHTLPGPASISGILARAGIPDDVHTTIPAALNALESTSIASVRNMGTVCPLRTPLHFALQRQQETGPGDTWVGNWAAATDNNPDQEHSLLSLSKLFYREQLLLDAEEI